MGSGGTSAPQPPTSLAAFLSGRWGRVALGSMAGLAARSVSVLTLLVIIPFASAQLGPDRFGLWMLVSGFAMIFGFADFGIGGSILNAVGAAEARGDHAAARAAISSGGAAITGIAAVFLVLALIAVMLIDWPIALGIRDPVAAVEARPAVIAFVFCFALQLPLNVAATVQAALQRTYLASTVQAAGNLLAFLLVLAGLAAGWSVPLLILAFFGASTFAAAVNSCVYFGVFRSDLAPRRAAATVAEIRRHIGTGVWFLGLQLGGIALIRFDPLIVASRFGLAEAGLYAAVDRLYALASVVAAALLGPLWPAYRDAFVRGDAHWWRRTLLSSTAGMMAVAGLTGVMLIAASGWLDHAWLRLPTTLPAGLFAAMTLLRVGEVGFGSLAAFLNGAGRLRLSLGLMVAMLAIGLPLKLLPWAGSAAIAAIGGALYLAGLACGFWLVLHREPRRRDPA